jgi:hypothetical protein
MSRRIVDDHLFTPEEVSYLQARNRYREIELNAKSFGPGGDRENEVPPAKASSDAQNETLELDKDIYDYVVSLDINQVKAALRKVNIQPVGEEPQLRSALAQHLQENRDANG